LDKTSEHSWMNLN